MADNVHTITVRSYSTGIQGRAIANSRNHHMVIDDGVPGEEIGAAEAFLSGISGCAVTLISRVARDRGVPLSWVDAVIEADRDNAADPIHPDVTVYHAIRMRIELTGVDDDQAQELVAAYRSR